MSIGKMKLYLPDREDVAFEYDALGRTRRSDGVWIQCPELPNPVPGWGRKHP